MNLHKKSILAITSIVLGFIIIRYFNGYNVFYQISELFSVFVGIMIFVIAYFTYEHTQNKFLLSIGIGYLISAIYLMIAVLKTGNLFANVFHEHLYLWTFPRAIESIFILSSIAFLKESYERALLIVSRVYTLVMVSLILTIINLLPDINHIQTTMSILTIIVTGIITFQIQELKEHFSSHTIYKFFSLSLVFSIFAQIVILIANQCGGFLCSVAIITQVVSFLLLFHAVVVFGFDKPFRLMAERKKISSLENKLFQDEELINLYENVFTNTNNGILVTDKRSRIILVNKAFSKITEFSENEVIGQKPSILRSERQSKEFYAEMWKTLIREDRWDGEVWNRKKHGEVYPQWLSISVIRDEHGNIKNFISNFSDISIIKKSQEAIEYMAHHDNLTGLVNRVLLKSHLDNAIKMRKREHGVGALLYLDLDKFKYVNDTYGHGAGDILLQFVAERLKKSVRSSDIVARVGGDEFIVLLTKVSTLEDIRLVANKIINEISRSFDDIVEQKIYIGTSIGGVIFPEQSDNVEDVIKFADIAMFESKSGGRNRFTQYVNKLKDNALEKAQLERDLRMAIIGNEFILFYQPQINSETKEIMSAEALIRWKHPSIGLMPPMKFIHIAEESDLIIDIGRWVILEACKQMVIWKKHGINLRRISVNISTIQFMKTDMVNTVRELVEKSGCDPHNLEIEITERVLIDNKETMNEILKQLGEMGVEFAIDDFGTGYSSLSYLRQLPFNTIKIDRSFIMETPHNKDDVAITKSVIALGKLFNYRVIAEGVETQEQLEFLKDLKCDIIQGFLYAQPMSPIDFEKFYFEQIAFK